MSNGDTTPPDAQDAQPVSPKPEPSAEDNEALKQAQPPATEQAASTGNNADLINRIIPIAVQYEASDIYMVVGYYPSMKVHGKIFAITEGFDILSDGDVHTFINAMTSDKQKKKYEEDLELDFSYSHGKARFRVNIFHQMKHPSLCMRYLRSDIPSIKSLGLPAIAQWLAERPSGIVLMAGPTGSGKSTTLSAMLDHINTNFSKHIITIEDPVEYLHPIKKSIVEQREVETDCVSFSRAMKSALRQNPNVLLLGEMRDLESVSSAITIAETGHLVFSTIHARSSVQTINKIIDAFPGEQQNQIRQQLSETLLAVLSQRLIPRKDGKGQVMAMEVMVINSAIANMIREEQTHQIESVIQTGKKEGMQLIDDDLLRLIQEDQITIEAAMEHSNSPQSLRNKLISLGLLE